MVSSSASTSSRGRPLSGSWWLTSNLPVYGYALMARRYWRNSDPRPVRSLGLMERTTLGTTGIQVSRYCLGAMMLGAWGNRDHDDSIRIIHTALDAGINFIDTADVYSAGESEEIVGKALKGRRDSVVLATKFVAPMGEDTNQRGASGAGSCRKSTTASGVSAPTTSTSTRPTARTRPWISTTPSAPS